MNARGALLLAVLSLPLRLAWAEGAVVATYNTRPPYMMPGDGGAPAGLTGTPAAAAFEAAGIPVTWARLPTNRQLAMVKDPQARSCALGWFRTPERERYAKFTKPIYRDKNWMLLARADFHVGEDATLEAVLRRPGTRVLVKDSYSYGVHIDRLMARIKPAQSLSTGAPVQMLQSVSAGLADFMFVSEDEARFLLANSGEHAKKLRMLHLKDMPRGSERHIMCGMGVPDEVITRLNQAITFK